MLNLLFKRPWQSRFPGSAWSSFALPMQLQITLPRFLLNVKIRCDSRSSRLFDGDDRRCPLRCWPRAVGRVMCGPKSQTVDRGPVNSGGERRCRGNGSHARRESCLKGIQWRNSTRIALEPVGAGRLHGFQRWLIFLLAVSLYRAVVAHWECPMSVVYSGASWSSVCEFETLLTFIYSRKFEWEFEWERNRDIGNQCCVRLLYSLSSLLHVRREMLNSLYTLFQDI